MGPNKNVIAYEALNDRVFGDQLRTRALILYHNGKYDIMMDAMHAVLLDIAKTRFGVYSYDKVIKVIKKE